MPKLCTYTYEEYTIDEFEYTHNYFSYRFDCFFTKSDYVCTFESYDETEPVYFVRHPSKLKALNLMKKWLKTVNARDLYLREYKVDPKFPDVMISVREKPIGYHVTTTENADRILKEGLIPNGIQNNEVYLASCILDEIKPGFVDSGVIRSQSSYVYPVFNNEQFFAERENLVLLAVELPALPMWVGDQGWAGLCLFFDEWDEKQIKKHAAYVRRDVGKKYWKHSMSVAQFIQSSSVDHDEILITGTVSASQITQIGFWDQKCIFHEQNHFTSFVKEQYRHNYLDILSQYKK